MKVIKSNHQEIYGLTVDQRNILKEHLTFDNPAYKNAKRYGRSRFISIPPYLTYYGEKNVRVDDFSGERKKVMTVPIGVNLCKVLDVPVIETEDERFEVSVKFPKFNLELREDQKKAETAYMQEQKFSVYPKNIIQLPTGKGKSILALHIAYRLGQKTLILVHKDDLVVGWKKDIKLCFGNVNVGLLKAKSRTVGDQITIATVQTLNRMSEDEFSTYIDQFGLVVQDECHHVGLNIFNIIDQFNSKYKLGLSATPKRSDGLDFVFDMFFGGMCYVHKVTESDEDISQVKVKVIDSPFKYTPFVVDGQPFNYHDFTSEELPDNLVFVEDMPYESRPRIPYLTIDNEAVTSDETGILVCNAIINEYKKGHSILALFTQKEHINMYYEYLKQFISEDKIMLYYGDSKESSANMMKKAENKEVMVTLATYAKATEGTNVRSWEVLFLVSSLNNAKNVEQATGRIRRKKEGKINPVIVYDVRYSGCYSLRSHYATRLSAYKKLKYIVEDSRSRKLVFTRGYN